MPGMKNRSFALGACVAALWLTTGCGEQPKPTPDAGVDTSCGIDCVAQERYGLIVNRCFEYSDTSTDVQLIPAVGVQVSEVRELEGGVKVVSVDYYRSGLREMTDNFMLVDGALKLARREWHAGPGGSVTYRDEANNIVGVTWLQPDTAAGQNVVSDVVADVVSGMRTSEPTTYTVVTSAPSMNEKTVPAGTYENAVKLIFNEQPAHGYDGRRVFSEGVGFPVFSSTFALGTTGGTPYYLQGIRDIGTADGGTHACGFAP